MVKFTGTDCQHDVAGAVLRVEQVEVHRIDPNGKQNQQQRRKSVDHFAKALDQVLWALPSSKRPCQGVVWRNGNSRHHLVHIASNGERMESSTTCSSSGLI